MQRFLGFFLLSIYALNGTYSVAHIAETIKKLRQKADEGDELSRQTLIDLYKKVHQPQFIVNPRIMNKLLQYNLVNTDGKIHSIVKNYIKKR
jgi:hypothetical protein